MGEGDGKGKDTPDSFDHSAFTGAAGEVRARGGFEGADMKSKKIRKAVRETARVLSAAVDSALPEEVPDDMRSALEENAFIFSGFKTYHSLREVGLSLTTDDGKVKPFNDFQKDVEKIDAKYNTNYLWAEYNHAVAASQMAAKWRDFEKDGDRYLLQYRTAGDDKVRPEHARLDGTTLPPSDPFWDKYLPPLSWNCFTGDTPVLCGNGKWAPIKDVREGMSVVGGSGQVKTVGAVMVRPYNGELVAVLTERGAVSCTPNHRFLTPRGWVPADGLHRGDIVIQVGEVSPLRIAVRTVHNLYALVRSRLVSLVRQRKTVASLTVHNEPPDGNVKVKDIFSDQLSGLKNLPDGTEKIPDIPLGHAQRIPEGGHTLGVRVPGPLSADICLADDIGTVERAVLPKFFAYAADKVAVLFRLALSHMSALKRKVVVYRSKAFARIRTAFGVANPLGGDSLATVPYGNPVSAEKTGNTPAIDVPECANLPEAELLRDVPQFKGITNPGAFNGFNSVLQFVRKTFFHNDYVLVCGKITKKAETSVYNLSVDDDESYVIPQAIVHNCRCTTVQVRRGKYPESDPAAAMAAGDAATESPKLRIFRYNPGKTLKVFPPKHPYYPKGCGSCSRSGSGASLSLAYNPNSKICQACAAAAEAAQKEFRKFIVSRAKTWSKNNIDEHKGLSIDAPNFASGSVLIIRGTVNGFIGHNADTIVIRRIENIPSDCKNWKYIGWKEVDNDPVTGERKHPDTEYFLYYETELNGVKRYVNVKAHNSFMREVPYCVTVGLDMTDMKTGLPPGVNRYKK